MIPRVERRSPVRKQAPASRRPYCSAEGGLSLSGTLTRQREHTLGAGNDAEHVANMGRLVEDMENNLRDAMQVIYFGKTKSVVNRMYKEAGAAESNKQADLQRQLQAEMARKVR